MSPNFHRGRFFTLAPSNIGISSRFNSVPIIMEKSDLLERDRSEFNRYSILPHIGGDQPFSNGLAKGSSRQGKTIDSLYALLPRGRDNELPLKALDLTAEEDVLLAHEVGRNIGSVELQNLMDAVTQFSAYDRDGAGVTDFAHVEKILSKNKVCLTHQLLRLVTARFVSARFPGKVNYEKLMSFLGEALKYKNQPSNGPDHAHISSVRDALDPPRHATSPQHSVRSHDGRLAQFHDDGPLETNRPHPASDFGLDRSGLTDILRDLKFNPDFRHIDLNALRHSFQRADSMHRGALSEQQIKDICYRCNLPLSDSLAAKIIRNCPYKGGGQYDWQEFLRILERVRPQATGLYIPRSRRPLEMARQSHEASSEWPHGAHAFTSRMPLPSRGSRASSHGSNQPLFREMSPTPRDRPQRSDFYTQHEYHQPEFHQPEDDLMQLHLQQHQQHQQLQQQNQYFRPQQQQAYAEPRTNPSPPPPPLPLGTSRNNENSAPLPPQQLAQDDKSPWLNRFVKLVDALYGCDKSATGFLDESEARRLVNDYNYACHLELSQADIDRAIEKYSRESNGRMRVDINGMLRDLAVPKG